MITKEMVTRKLNFDSGSGKDSKPTTMRRVSQRNAEKPKQKTKYDLTRLSTSEFNNLIEGVDPQLEVVNKNVIAQKKLETGQKKKSEMNIHAEVNRTNNIYEDSGSSSESDTEISNHQGSLPKKSLNPSSNNANSSQPHSNEANSSHGHSKDSQFQFGASVSTELVHCSPNKSSLITTNKSSCPNLSSSSVLGSKIQLGISKKVESLSKTVFGPKVTCPPKQLNMSMNSLATASHVNPSGTGPEVSTDVGSHSPKSDTSGKENDGKDNVPSDKSIHGPTNVDEGQSKDKGSPKHDGEDFLSNDTDLNDTLATTADKSTQTHSVFVGCDCLSCAEILKTFFAHNGPITNQRGVDTDREISNLSSSTLLPHATPNNNTVNSDGEQMTPIVQGCPTVMIPLSAKGALPTEVPDRDPKKIVGYLLESMYPTVELAKMTHDGKTKNSTKLPKNVAKTLLVYTAAKYDKKKFKFNGTLFKSFVNDKFYTARRWVWKHRPELVEQGVVRGPMKKHTKKETDSTADKAKAGGNKSRKRKTERRTKSNSKEVIHADSKKKKKEKERSHKGSKRSHQSYSDKSMKRKHKNEKSPKLHNGREESITKKIRHEKPLEQSKLESKARNDAHSTNGKGHAHGESVKINTNTNKGTFTHSTPNFRTGGKRPKSQLDDLITDSLEKHKEPAMKKKKKVVVSESDSSVGDLSESEEESDNESESSEAISGYPSSNDDDIENNTNTSVEIDISSDTE